MRVSSRHKKHKKELQPFYAYIKATEADRKKEYEQFLERVSGNLSIPKDVIAGQAMLSMAGNHCIRVCNYKAIEEYSTECVKLSSGRRNIVISGTHLLIEVLRKDEIKIIGNILNISFNPG